MDDAEQKAFADMEERKPTKHFCRQCNQTVDHYKVNKEFQCLYCGHKTVIR